MKRRRWRWLAKLYANWNGFFWIPCRVCGEYFGGHEVGGSIDNPDELGSGWCVCSKECEDRHRGLSRG